jgi:alkylhydroperoxidase family enzyme
MKYNLNKIHNTILINKKLNIGGVIMARIDFSKEGNTLFEQLLGHNSNVLEKWSSLELVFFKSNTFSDELKEQVRRTLAFNNGCQYCMAKGKPSENITDPKTLAAVKFADMFCKNNIGDIELDVLKSVFKDDEVSELCAFICFISASQKFGATLDLQPSCSL